MRITGPALAVAAVCLAAGKPHRVFVTGDHEYSGEQTLPLLAKELEARYGFTCTVLKAAPNQNSEENIPGLEALRGADLAIFYLRWRITMQPGFMVKRMVADFVSGGGDRRQGRAVFL